MLGRSVSRLAPLGLEGNQRVHIERARRGEPVQEWETQRLRADGTVFPASITLSSVRSPLGEPIGLAMVMRDVTDRKRLADLAHREAQRRWAADLLTQIPAGVAVLRGPDHILDFVNPAFLESLGTRDCLGKPAREVFPEVQGQGYFELLDHVYATGELFTATEAALHLDNGDGTVREAYFNFSYQPLRNPDGEIYGIFAYGVEVTGMVRSRQQVEGLAAELARLYGREHRITNTLQHSFLPERLPELDGVALAGRYLAGSREVDIGGDWYDVRM